MPAQSATSADKVRAAQAARRSAAQRSAANRPSRPKMAVPAAQAESTPSDWVASSTSPAGAHDPMTALCALVEDSPSALGADTNSVRQLCRNRRHMLATKGKSAATSSANNGPSGRQRPQVSTANRVVLEKANDESSTSAEAELASLCELVDTNPDVLGPDANSIRQICRNRRQALASMGKRALAGKRKTASRASVAASFLNGDTDGRELARKHRQRLASKGRVTNKPARPSGRIRPKPGPVKVETGTTLSGNAVSGTQVERKGGITGTEAGTCRTITGTEYIGSEQFLNYCQRKPEPNEPPKVGFSITSGGMPVSGTEMGRSAKVTGDEQGSCSSVTGTEYLGAERFNEFCENKGLVKRPEKVVSGQTERRNMTVTGVDGSRLNQLTGSEAGAKYTVTGSQYADAGAAKLTINGPAKVALTHTIAGRPVTGTEVGQSAKVTGDRQGSCQTVTGTEYLSNEQFAGICQQIPPPGPAKVGVGHSRKALHITGNLMDRSDKVTGNEPGSCQRVTGSQYGEAKLCAEAPAKTAIMHTLAGRELTGTQVDHSPKFNGGGHAGCQSVTGTEYNGKEQFAENCTGTPVAAPEKVGVERTAGGQRVSGTLLSHVPAVTGNESGSQRMISGTPYADTSSSPAQGACCHECAVKQLAETAGLLAPYGADVGTRPSAEPQSIAVNHTAPPAMPTMQAVIPNDFSIVSPARAAQSVRQSHGITGNSYDGQGRVTGPVNMGSQWVSGTPEFRHNHNVQPRHVIQPQPLNAAQSGNPMMAIATAPVAPAQGSIATQAEQIPAVSNTRITGEGRDGGIGITGDNWSRGHQITGTEGRSAQGRNPTLQCEARGVITNAQVNRQMERAAAPTSMITGSSGNTHQGAVITVSGGARG